MFTRVSEYENKPVQNFQKPLNIESNELVASRLNSLACLVLLTVFYLELETRVLRRVECRQDVLCILQRLESCMSTRFIFRIQMKALMY